eukprot:scpid35054/ scgid8949/ 
MQEMSLEICYGQPHSRCKLYARRNIHTVRSATTSILYDSFSRIRIATLHALQLTCQLVTASTAVRSCVHQVHMANVCHALSADLILAGHENVTTSPSNGA